MRRGARLAGDTLPRVCSAKRASHRAPERFEAHYFLRFVVTFAAREAHRERAHERTSDAAPVLHEPLRERLFSCSPESG